MYCYIDNKKVDLDYLSKYHPGGKKIQAFENMDATVIYKSMHMHSDDRIDKYVLYDDEYKYNSSDNKNILDSDYIFDTEFSKEVRSKVRNSIANYYAPLGWWLRFILIITLTLLAESMYRNNVTILTAMFVGFMHAQIGFCIQHSASHGAIHPNTKVNDVLTLFADYIGASKYMWFQQHIMFHHKDTNRINRDPDIHSAEPIFYFVRNRINRSRLMQIITFPILYLYGLDVIYKIHAVIGMEHSRKIPNLYFKSIKRRASFIFFKLFYLYRIVIYPWYQGNNLFMSFFFVPFFTGIFLVTTFILSHNTDKMEHTEEDKKNVDWYKMQVESSCTYKSLIGWFLTDGLNYQIEHHLFPRMNPWHYPQISNTVKAVCKKHNVKYTEYNGFISNMRATLKYLFINNNKINSK